MCRRAPKCDQVRICQKHDFYYLSGIQNPNVCWSNHGYNFSRKSLCSWCCQKNKQLAVRLQVVLISSEFWCKIGCTNAAPTNATPTLTAENPPPKRHHCSKPTHMQQSCTSYSVYINCTTTSYAFSSSGPSRDTSFSPPTSHRSKTGHFNAPRTTGHHGHQQFWKRGDP